MASKTDLLLLAGAAAVLFLGSRSKGGCRSCGGGTRPSILPQLRDGTPYTPADTGRAATGGSIILRTGTRYSPPDLVKISHGGQTIIRSDEPYQPRGDYVRGEYTVRELTGSYPVTNQVQSTGPAVPGLGQAVS